MTPPHFPSDDRPAPTPSHPPGPAATRPRLRLRLLLAGLAAGLASWLVGETPLVRVPAPENKMTVMGHTFEASTPQGRQAAGDADAARFYGLFGASLGLAFGLVGGLSRRSGRQAALAALLGVAAGAVYGLIAAGGAVPLYHRLHYVVPNDLIASLAMHGAVFAAAGAAGGLALGVGLGDGVRLVRSTFVGALGALVGAVAFEFLGALLFASSETGQPLAATATARLLAPLLVSGFTALGFATT
jgi:hypothetical protein